MGTELREGNLEYAKSTRNGNAPLVAEKQAPYHLNPTKTGPEGPVASMTHQAVRRYLPAPRAPTNSG
jgi:hypothetical protein